MPDTDPAYLADLQAAHARYTARLAEITAGGRPAPDEASPRIHDWTDAMVASGHLSYTTTGRGTPVTVTVTTADTRALANHTATPAQHRALADAVTAFLAHSTGEPRTLAPSYGTRPPLRTYDLLVLLHPQPPADGGGGRATSPTDLPADGATGTCHTCHTPIVWKHDEPPYGHWLDRYDADLCPRKKEEDDDPGHAPATYSPPSGIRHPLNRADATAQLLGEEAIAAAPPAPTGDGILLLTVEGSGYGPYVAAPLAPAEQPWAEHLFTRDTAEQIVTDLHRHDADCGLTARWHEDGTLTFTWEPGYLEGDKPGTRTITPTEHGLYPIGGLWPWDEWTPQHYDHTAGQAAFAHGAAAYRDAAPAPCPDALTELYDRGRAEAHRVTLHRDAPQP
ncbi:hypothetical protein [Streptomyces sp. NBC_00470]|uniref:hypothetical protein n=1 Tax=Streptomyces sp. NBC_00470 TaxID=2975753 RepID=UPI002F909749